MGVLFLHDGLDSCACVVGFNVAPWLDSLILHFAWDYWFVVWLGLGLCVLAQACLASSL